MSAGTFAIYSCFMMKLSHIAGGTQVGLVLLLVAVLELAFAGHCLGDQLQWNPLPVCRDAAKVIARQPLLVSFCSQADEDYVELWLVRGLEAVTTSAPSLYEVVLSVKRLYRSDRAFSSEDFPVPEEQWGFHEAHDPGWFAVGIDLAYVYVYEGGTSFRCVARVLGLPCAVGVDAICLPDHVLKEAAVCRQAKRQTTAWLLDEASERCLRSSR